jgi:Uncharacterized protein conserved in bacteria
MKQLIVTLGFCLFSVLSVGQQVANSIWKEANSDYQKGDFVSAETKYQSIINQGLHSADLYYNLGNAQFKQHKLAQAIIAYRRAIRLSPSNNDYKFNLELAKLQVVDKIESIPPFFMVTWISGVKHLFGPNGWAKVAIFLFCLFSASIILSRFGNGIVLKRIGFWGSLGTFVIFCVAISISFSERSQLQDRTEAVILSPVVTIKSSPDNSGKDLFILHEGTTITVTDSLSAWYEIKVSDGNKGWIPSMNVEKI